MSFSEASQTSSLHQESRKLETFHEESTGNFGFNQAQKSSKTSSMQSSSTMKQSSSSFQSSNQSSSMSMSSSKTMTSSSSFQSGFTEVCLE